MRTGTIAYSISALLILLSTTVASATMSPREIYKTRGPGVVLIVASQEGSSSASAGTGSIIKENGTIVTNCHVIFDEKTKAPFPVINIFLKPDRITGNMNNDLTRHFTGSVIAYDHDLDLALLKINNTPADLTVVPLGDPEAVGPGDETVAIGHPEQGGLWTITTGVIGTEFQNFKGIPGKDVFQMETSLNRGNSGGPLFDVRGFQVGVNTAIARQGEGGVAITGVNFAVKASVVKKWAASKSLLIAYAIDSATTDERVAVAEQPSPARTAEAKSPVAQTSLEGSGDTGSCGACPPTVESSTGGIDSDGGREIPVKAKKQQPARTNPPQRFENRYVLPPHPYTYKKLFKEVDTIRARAQDAFDDLENQAQRHRQR
jgi:serine protease Do